MGRRGPAPKPTALKVLQGNPGKRALPKDEPKPKLAIPPIPTWLDARAKAEWRRMAPMLFGLGLMTEADGAALAAYCQSYSDFAQATEVLAEHGYTFLTPNGFVQARPEVSIANRAKAHIKVFCQEFGMTPSARARMSVPEKVREPDGMEALLQ